MRIAFASDWHLDFTDELERWVIAQIVDAGVPLLFGGDLSVATSYENHLKYIAEVLPVPIYTVFGNHDFYYGSFSEQHYHRKEAQKNSSPANVTSLDYTGFIQLADGVYVVGESGWYGARDEGRPPEFYPSPNNAMNDWEHIREFQSKRGTDIYDLCRNLAYEAAMNLNGKLVHSLPTDAKSVIILTHVPPFIEAIRKIDALTPFYHNATVGTVIEGVAKHHPDTHFTVLCGHTHREKLFRRNNVSCYVTHASYGESNVKFLERQGDGSFIPVSAK